MVVDVGIYVNVGVFVIDDGAIWRLFVVVDSVVVFLLLLVVAVVGVVVAVTFPVDFVALVVVVFFYRACRS